MRTNGTFQYQIIVPGEVNEFGEPTEATTVWSDPIACSIKTNSDNRKGKYEDGEFRMASFTVLIENDETAQFDRVKLTRHSEELGEYRVMNREPLTTVGRIQIVV